MECEGTRPGGRCADLVVPGLGLDWRRTRTGVRRAPEQARRGRALRAAFVDPPNRDEELILKELRAQGATPLEAEKLVAYLPLAFRLVMVRDMGPRFPDSAIFRSEGMRGERPVFLPEDPLWREALRLAEKTLAGRPLRAISSAPLPCAAPPSTSSPMRCTRARSPRTSSSPRRSSSCPTKRRRSCTTNCQRSDAAPPPRPTSPETVVEVLVRRGGVLQRLTGSRS